MFDILILALLTVITAATPLLFAALGEMITEKSGVLNLGVEGMMLMGAISGFIVVTQTDSILLAIVASAFAGAALGGGASGTEAERGDLVAPVDGIQGAASRGVPIQPVLRSVSGVGEDSGSVYAPGPQSGREAVRGLLRANGSHCGSGDGGDLPGPSVCRGSGRFQLHLCGGCMGPEPCELDRLPCACF